MVKAFTRANSLNEQDLHDSPQDEEKMRPEETIMELPDVRDIPGQEHIHVPPLGELADTTISSDDEEGKGILDDEDENELGGAQNVSEQEKQALYNSASVTSGEDAENLQKAALDNTDEEGEELAEVGFGEDVSGSDLDVPGAELDDEIEDIGSEDEENNTYSRGGVNNDNMTEGTP